MKLSIWILSVIFFSTYSFAKESILKNIETSKNSNEFLAKILFENEVNKDQIQLEFINETIQVNLANVKVDNSKIHSKISDANIKSIYTYQVNDTNARSRIILNSGLAAADFKDKVSLSVDGNAVLVKISDKSQVTEVITDEQLQEATKWAESSQDAKAETSSLAKTEAPKLNENKKESEIPVFSENKKEAKEVKSLSMSRLFFSLGLIGALLLGATLYLKKLSKKAPKNKNSQIKILTQYYVGPRKSLAIVRVAGESILVGITDQNISLIKTLALLDEEIPQDTPKNFHSSLEKYSDNNQNEETPDEFSFSKVKDFVSGKLKNMKEL